MRSPRTLAFLLLAAVAAASSATAGWLPNGVPLFSASPEVQNNPAIIPDGAGGAIVVWEDYRDGTAYDIYAQRLDGSGNLLWGSEVPVCVAVYHQSSPKLVPDGAGGAIITWQDGRSGTARDIYAQRVDASGNALWTANGVAVCTDAYTQDFPEIVSDGAGGAVILWRDSRSISETDIYAQRLDGSGTAQWTAGGVPVCAAAGNQYDIAATTDGAGGAILAWRDLRSGGNYIYAARVDFQGNRPWTTDGVSLPKKAALQENPAIVSDGAGGAIIAWDTHLGGAERDIEAQRVDATGSILWHGGDKDICTFPAYQRFAAMVTDGAGGAIIVWQDSRSGLGSEDVYAQRVNAAGAVQWTTDGVPVCAAGGRQSAPAISADAAGGALITWDDERAGTGDIYASRLDASGNAVWLANGVPVCTAENSQGRPAIAFDGAGGAVLSWQDSRVIGKPGIFAQRIPFATTGAGDPRIGAATLRVFPNHPNPFPAATDIRFALAEPSAVTLTVLDLSGRVVSVQTQSAPAAGEQEIRFEGRDRQGRDLPSGVYFYRITAVGYETGAVSSRTRRMVRLR